MHSVKGPKSTPSALLKPHSLPETIVGIIRILRFSQDLCESVISKLIRHNYRDVYDMHIWPTKDTFHHNASKIKLGGLIQQ